MSLYGKADLPGPGARVVIVARFSTNQQNPLGADDQIRILREDCDRLGWIVIGVFKDEGKSGRSIKKRKGYLEAMAMAATGDVDGRPDGKGGKGLPPISRASSRLLIADAWRGSKRSG